LDEQSIYDRDCSWNIVSVNFEFLLFWNHGDVTWDCPKAESFGKKGIFKHIVLGRVRGAIGTL
jgi:hypothetical protein